MVCKDKHQNDNLHQKTKSKQSQKRLTNPSIKKQSSSKKRQNENKIKNIGQRQASKG
jgi:hypothetical protein